MLLNNFYNLWAYISCHYDFSGQTTAFLDIGLKNNSGNTRELIVRGSTGSAKPSYFIFMNLDAKLGDGTDEPTVDDYYLSGNELSFSDYTTVYTVTNDNGKIVVTMSISGYNNTDAQKTINEIVVTKDIMDSTTYQNFPLAIAREVLETPVVVEPNSGFALTFKLEFQ